MSDILETYAETPVDLKDASPEITAALVDHMPANETEWSMHYLELSRLCRKLVGERDEWKAAHDNQVKLKQIISDRPDLKERAKLVAELIEERDECKRLAIEQHYHIKELDIDNKNHYQLITKLIEERDGWREAAYSLGEAIPASWEELQPPAEQLAKFKEMVQLQNEKYKL